MRAQGYGRIVNTVSEVALDARFDGGLGYGAAKAAVWSATLHAARHRRRRRHHRQRDLAGRTHPHERTRPRRRVPGGGVRRRSTCARSTWPGSSPTSRRRTPATSPAGSSMRPAGRCGSTRPPAPVDPTWWTGSRRSSADRLRNGPRMDDPRPGQRPGTSGCAWRGTPRVPRRRRRWRTARPRSRARGRWRRRARGARRAARGASRLRAPVVDRSRSRGPSARPSPARVASPLSSLTSPSRWASSASSGAPVSSIWSATPRGRRRGSRWVPPAPGSRPSLISGTPRRASVGGDPEIARERELEPAAERGAVDGGDRRLRVLFEPIEDVGEGAHEPREAGGTRRASTTRRCRRRRRRLVLHR